LYTTDRNNGSVRVIQIYPEDPVPYNNGVGLIQSPSLSLTFQGQFTYNPVYNGPTLPTSVTPALWWDASDASTIVSNGTALTGWKNKGSLTDNTNGTVTGSVTIGNRIGGRNVITFSQGSYLRQNYNNTGAFRSNATFVVSRILNNLNELFNVYFLQSANSTTDEIVIRYYVNADNDRLYKLSRGNIATNDIDKNTNLNEPRLYSFVESGTTTNLNAISINGTNQSLSSNNPIASDYSDSGTYLQLNDGNPSNRSFQQIAEILQYRVDLTTNERHQIEAYLAYKWNLPMSSSNPYSPIYNPVVPTPNMLPMAGKTLVFCFKPLASTSETRLFDFNSSDPSISINMTPYSTNNPSLATTISPIGGTDVQNQIMAQSLALNTQYIFTLYFTATSPIYTSALYIYNGRSITTLSSGISVDAGLRIQTIVNNLYLGRSRNLSDPYFNASYQKVALYEGNLSNLANTIELQKLLVGSPANTFTSDSYTFNTSSQFLPVTVAMYNNPSRTRAEVTLNGIDQYLTISSYTQ
jgi:hypothetical protein